MSELKYYKLFIRASALTSPEFISVVEFGTNDEVYLKSEADAYIAELEEKHKMEVEQLLIEMQGLKKQVQDYAQGLYVVQARAEKELRHHKYQRCLAMAKWCKAEQTYSSFAIYITEHPKSRWANKSVPVGAWLAFWKNREQRLLKLADKFKKEA